jgi:hypothetical protein
VTPGTCDAIGERDQASDPNVGEGPGRLEHLPPTKTRSHEGKAISYE